MTSRSSSGSIRVESAVEPTRSANMTVTCRRSAVSGSEASSASCRSERAADAFAGNADIFQVLGRQARQQRFVDIVFTKCRFVLLQAEAQQPAAKIHDACPTHGGYNDDPAPITCPGPP